jgi:hypothetical protein
MSFTAISPSIGYGSNEPVQAAFNVKSLLCYPVQFSAQKKFFHDIGILKKITRA